MNKWLNNLSAGNSQAESLVRQTALLTAATGMLVWLSYVAWRYPVMLGEPGYTHQYIPTPFTILPAVAFFSLGVATLISLFTHNRQRLRAVLRPTKGRVIGAIILGFLTPIVVFNWVPWIVIGTAMVLSSETPLLLPLALLPALLWYLPSCLIVSGIKSRPMRVATYALFWWAGYSGLILFNGILNFVV